MLHPLSYFETLYNVLFHPVVEFRLLAREQAPKSRFLLYGFATVVAISATAPVVETIRNGSPLEGLALSIPISVVLGVIFWMLTGSLVAAMAYAFGARTHWRTILTLSALATLPWVFNGPLTLMKYSMGFAGALMGVLGGLGVWLWSVILFALAIGITYRMTLERVLIILALPFALSGVFVLWTIGFIGNIRQLFP